MDEIAVPRLHQWLSGCRMLMHAFPQLGIDMIDLASGMGMMRWTAGWNQSSTHFVFVPETPDDGPAFTTKVPPPPGTPIHRVPPGPTMLSSYFWHTVMPGFSEDSQPDAAEAGWPLARMAAVARSIEHSHVSYERGGPTPELMALARPYAARMKRAQTDAHLGTVRIEEFLAPALDVVRSYMAFEIPGKVASEVLALLLSIQGTLPDFGLPTTTPPAARATMIEHLVAVFNRLLGDRKLVQVTPYYEMAYLANVYEMAASVLVTHAEEGGGLPPERLAQLRDLRFTVEERSAHNLRFDFGLVAIDRAPAHLAEKAQGDRISLRAACREFAVHPALREVVLGQAAGALAPARTVSDYQQAAASYDDFDVLAAVDSALSPIAPAIRDRVAAELGR